MHRPSTRRTTAMLFGGGAAFGGAAAAYGGIDAGDSPLSLICGVLAAVAVSRAARKRASEARDLEAREKSIAAREHQLDRRARILDLRMGSTNGRIDQLLRDRALDAAAYAELRINYERLALEYNELVLEQAAQGSTVLSSPFAAGHSGRPCDDIGTPRRARRSGPHPALSLVDTMERHESG